MYDCRIPWWSRDKRKNPIKPHWIITSETTYDTPKIINYIFEETWIYCEVWNYMNMSINDWVAPLTIIAVFLSSPIEWMCHGKVYLHGCVEFSFDFGISKFMRSILFQLLFVPSEEFAKNKFFVRALILLALGFWFLIIQNPITESTKRIHTNHRIIKCVRFHRHCWKFFTQCFPCVQIDKNSYIISISLSCNACAQAFVWSFLSLKNRHTKTRNWIERKLECWKEDGDEDGVGENGKKHITLNSSTTSSKSTTGKNVKERKNWKKYVRKLCENPKSSSWTKTKKKKIWRNLHV